MTTEKKNPSIIKIITITAGIIGAVEVIGGFIAKTWLDSYIEDKVEARIIAVEEEKKKKKSFRSLIAPKMALPEDEIHIKIGTDHKTEDAFRNSVLTHLEKNDEEIEKLKKFDKRVRTEVIHYHPGTHLQVMPD